MSRPRVYASDNERLQAWRERKRQELNENQEQSPLEKLALQGDENQEEAIRGTQEQLDQAVKRLEFIGESMAMKGYCSPAEATDMQVLVRVAVREPGLFEKWRQERAQTPLRGLLPWREE